MTGPERLKKWRGRRSQAVAAILIGVPQGQYSDWESGKKTPRIDSLEKIRVATRIPLKAWARPASRSQVAEA